MKENDKVKISKSQRKRDMHALQAMGEKLVNLTAARLSKVPVPEELLFAIQEAKRMKSREARRRQLQYVGRLMRSVEIEPIQQALDKLEKI